MAVVPLTRLTLLVLRIVYIEAQAQELFGDVKRLYAPRYSPVIFYDIISPQNTHYGFKTRYYNTSVRRGTTCRGISYLISP